MKDPIATQPSRRNPKEGFFKMKVGVALLLALVFAGTAAGANANGGWTAKEMQQAAKALGYPKPGAKRVTCRGTSVFKCKAVYPRSRKTFVMASGLEGGWVCAGKTLHICRVLRKGFLPSVWVTGWGSLEAAAAYSSVGYIQKHYGVAAPQQAGGCNPFGTSGFTCSYSTPSVIVTITYRKSRGGWIVTGAG